MGKGGSCHVIWKKKEKCTQKPWNRKEGLGSRVLWSQALHSISRLQQQHVKSDQTRTKQKLGKLESFIKLYSFCRSFVSVDFGLPVCWTRLPSSDTVCATWSLIGGGRRLQCEGARGEKADPSEWRKQSAKVLTWISRQKEVTMSVGTYFSI